MLDYPSSHQTILIMSYWENWNYEPFLDCTKIEQEFQEWKLKMSDIPKGEVWSSYHARGWQRKKQQKY